MFICMMLFRQVLVLTTLVTVFVVASPKDVYWIDAGSCCQRDYGEDDRCIHYSNCISSKSGGLTKGYPEFCRFVGITPVLCCLEKDGLQKDSAEDYFAEREDHKHPPLVHSVIPKPYQPSYISKPPPPKYNQWQYHGHHHIGKPHTDQWYFPSNSDDGYYPQYPVRPMSDSKPTTSKPFTLNPQESKPAAPDDTTTKIPDLLSGSGVTNANKEGQQQGSNDLNSQTQPPDLTNNTLNTIQSIFGTGIGNQDNIAQDPSLLPSFQSNIYLQKCGEYFRKIPLLKGKHTPVIGGRPAKPQEFPHLALLGYGDPNDIQWLCGGSLISEEYVLTAAHCIFAKGIGLVRYVRLGELDLSTTTDNSTERDFTVRRNITHPSYSALYSYHDIALIQLNDTVSSITRFIRPACLPTARNFPSTAILVAAGWGLTEPGGAPATILQRASLRYVSNERCKRYYGTPRNLPNGIVEDLHICADGGTERRDTCQGDSGGPLQYTNYLYNETGLIGFVEVAGVTSFGKGCGLTAGVYTRVLPYVKWIENIVWPN